MKKNKIREREVRRLERIANDEHATLPVRLRAANECVLARNTMAQLGAMGTYLLDRLVDGHDAE